MKWTVTMATTHIKDFTKGNITRQLIAFSWPLLLANILQVVYNMVDMIVVGRVMGMTGTSAVTVGGDVVNLLTFIVMGFSAAGQVLIARMAKNKKFQKQQLTDRGYEEFVEFYNNPLN